MILERDYKIIFNRKKKLSKMTLFILLVSAFFIVGGWFMLRGKDDFNISKSEVLSPEILETDVIDRYLSSTTITIDGIRLNVDVGETAEEMARGLSGRTGLAEDEGMLFVYDKPDFYSFWMKDMNFPIDIIWINEDFEVVDITKNFKPESFPETVKPQEPAQYVVEVNAGWAEEHRIHIGSPVSLNNIKEETSEVVDTSKILPPVPASLQQATLSKKVLFDVPFTPQAPFGDWDDVRQDYGCEEAAILMAMYWVYDRDLPLEEAKKEIIAISEFEKEKYGDFHDTSTLDTLKVLKAYFGYENAFAKFDIGIEDIKAELTLGNLVIVPIDGTKVGNPYYTPPGPAKHKIVIRGYDDSTQEFITNDPGTKRGEGYRYNYQILENAIVDYPTGLNEPISQIRTAMIVVKK